MSTKVSVIVVNIVEEGSNIVVGLSVRVSVTVI